MDQPPRPDQLVRPRELVEELKDLFPSEGSLEWEIKQHRRDYIAGGALFEIAGRLLAHPQKFRCVALQIGARKLAARHGVVVT
jgi:hypothetical protein